MEDWRDIPTTPINEFSADALLESYLYHASVVGNVGFKTGTASNPPRFSPSEINALDFANDQMPRLRAEMIRRMEESLWTKP